MPQPSTIQALHVTPVEVNKALTKADAGSTTGGWSLPSQDFGQLFARVHAASKGQNFAATPARDVSSGMGGNAQQDLRSMDSNASWRAPKFEPQALRTRIDGQDRQADVPVQNRYARSDTNTQARVQAPTPPAADRTVGARDQQPAPEPVKTSISSKPNRLDTGVARPVDQRSAAPAQTKERVSDQVSERTTDKPSAQDVTSNASQKNAPADVQTDAQVAAAAVAMQVLSGLGSEPSEQDAAPPNDIMALELAGGMQIITATHVPNEASLAAFAAAQGMSPEAVAVLLNQAAGLGKEGGGLLGQTTAQWMTVADPSGAPEAEAALKAAVAAMGQGASGDGTDPTPDTLKQLLQGQAQLPPNTFTPQALGSTVGGQALALAQQQAAVLGGSVGERGPGQVSAQVAAQLLVSGLKAQAGAAPGSPGSNASASLAAQAMALDGVTEQDIERLLGARSAADASGLGRTSPVGGLEVVGAAVPRAAQPLGVALGTPGAAIAQRNEVYQGIADRLGEAMGARIAGQIAKGQWSMQLTLRPANLGKVDVDLSMRNGELDAKFAASSALTRDLLQDSLPKLREALSQAGTNIASVNINGGGGQKNHGNPTPHKGGNTQPMVGKTTSGGPDDGLSSAPVRETGSFGGDEPLNVWV